MVTRTRIRVLVVDHSEAMRLSLHQVLNAFTDLQWVGEVHDADVDDIVTQCERLCPDVVLLDVGWPHRDVTQIIRQLRHVFPTLQIIGIAGFEEQGLIDQILKAGAILCLSKTATVTAIADAIRWVMQSMGSVS